MACVGNSGGSPTIWFSAWNAHSPSPVDAQVGQVVGMLSRHDVGLHFHGHDSVLKDQSGIAYHNVTRH